MKFKDLTSMSAKELQEKMNELRLDLIKHGNSSATTGVKSSGQLREIKKTIARIKTILNKTEAQIKA